VVTSGLVARKLGLPWHFIHYTNALISGFAQSEDFNAYFPFAGNATSAFFTQDYFAVRYLKQHQLIPADAVFIPGHSGDFIAGGHLTPGLSPENLTTTLLQKHFSLRKGATSEFRDKIENSFLNTSADANFENWDLKERQAKFIINSNRIYEYWGFEHLIPLWDHELADFFPDIDLRYRLDKRLYDAVLFRHYFKPFQVDFTPKQYYSIVQKLKGVYNRIKRHLYTDNNNFKAIARELMRVGKPNVPWSSTQININSIQSAWYLLHFESQEKKKQK
jgi:asparagine synthase (glutamine-hydrolysing)